MIARNVEYDGSLSSPVAMARRIGWACEIQLERSETAVEMPCPYGSDIAALLRSLSWFAQAQRQHTADDERRADGRDRRRPAELIEHAPQNDAAGEASGIIGGKINPARRSARLAGRARNESGGGRLREEGSRRDQRKAAPERFRASPRARRAMPARRGRAMPGSSAFAPNRRATLPASGVRMIEGTNTK